MVIEQNKIRHPMLKVFLTASMLYLISLIPLLILSKGVFLWTGDFNFQSIPFVERIHRMLHSSEGLPAYDWNSFLGMDFLTGYSEFLFSPFNWILYLLPYRIVPYATTFVMAIKIGAAGAAAYLYCRQYVRTDRSAFICGILYALSSFQLFNMVYHFSDRYFLFPLTLYAFDQLIVRRKPLAFGLLIAYNCLMSCYLCWIFCVNILLYYIIRTVTGSFPKLTLRLFLRALLETVCGVCGGTMTMLPGMMILSHNSRVSNTIFGHSLLAYETPGVILRIIQSMFLPPDLCRCGFYFKDDQLSLSPPTLYLPLFGIVCVVYLWRRNKMAWYSVLLTACAVIGSIPLLNSIFSLFNLNYYARWCFLPLLIMILMTGMYLDDFSAHDPKPELIGCSVVLGFWILYGVYSVFFEEPMHFSELKHYWFMAVVIAAAGMGVLYLLYHPYPKLKQISPAHLGKITCIFCTLPFLAQSWMLTEENIYEFIPNIRSVVWNDFEPVELERDTFYRTSSCIQPMLNSGMRWDYPSLSCFNSMIPPEAADFFDSLDLVCRQNAILSDADYALCSFLSVKYELYFNTPNPGGVEVNPKDVRLDFEGFEKETAFHRYIPLRNTAYIPMGYTFDYYYCTGEKETAETVSEQDRMIEYLNIMAKGDSDEPELPTDSGSRQKLLLKAIWLTEEQVEKYGSLLEELPQSLAEDTSVETYYKDCKARAESACYEFTPNSKGFTARIALPKKNLVFFSVPYNDGFTACVDGNPVEIEKVFSGLCAVCVPQGDHSIEFRYELPGLRTGVLVSAVSVGILLLYTAADLLLKQKRRKQDTAQ
ncbi:MAG: YfhO family protein [Oscillospiraceae bacterium]|nr:YfhO family protein [Oscillospiraceae bacterium]